jgi:hypothetical protein
MPPVALAACPVFVTAADHTSEHRFTALARPASAAACVRRLAEAARADAAVEAEEVVIRTVETAQERSRNPPHRRMMPPRSWTSI